MRTTKSRLAALGAVAVLGLTGCASAEDDEPVGADGLPRQLV